MICRKKRKFCADKTDTKTKTKTTWWAEEESAARKQQLVAHSLCLIVQIDARSLVYLYSAVGTLTKSICNAIVCCHPNKVDLDS